MKFTSILAIFSALTVAVSAAPASNVESKDLVTGVTNSDIASDTKSVPIDANKASGQSSSNFEYLPNFVPFLITTPIEDVTYVTGSEVTTSWINGVEGPFKINLVTGPVSTEMQPTNIYLDVNDGTSGSYTWRIPEKLPSGKYAYRYIFKLEGKDAESYSTQFSIKKAAESSVPAKHLDTKEPGLSATSSKAAASADTIPLTP